MRNQLAGVWFTFLVIVTIKLTGSHLRKTGIVLAYHWGRLDGRSSLPAVAVRVRGCMLKSGWTRRQSAGDIVSQLASFLFKSFVYLFWTPSLWDAAAHISEWFSPPN